MELKVVFIGLGGIGSWVTNLTLRYLLPNSNKIEKVILIDGDDYEEKNNFRQLFYLSEKINPNKAIVKQKELQHLPYKFQAIPEYISEMNVYKILTDNSIIILGVDCQGAQKVVIEQSQILNNVCVLYANNELYNGEVSGFVRVNGIQLSKCVSEIHKEILHFNGISRAEMGCEELSLQPGREQTILANYFAAGTTTILLDKILKATNFLTEDNQHEVEEIFFDVEKVGMRGSKNFYNNKTEQNG